ncbi:hypothetical protein HHK36_018338 [Tetracentron sinense]|uniref:Cathepsin propeptide inhibitor domain-containing protein n=1 Tax=Tetracentron sinense TaxID=13715 RepID=A0A834Z3P9_TETSI|nr:hypothetical protein HHK36_018338 [Tetracentron sinense]
MESLFEWLDHDSRSRSPPLVDRSNLTRKPTERVENSIPVAPNLGAGQAKARRNDYNGRNGCQNNVPPARLGGKSLIPPPRGTMGSFASRILNVGNPSGDIREGIERSPGHGTIGSQIPNVGNPPGEIPYIAYDCEMVGKAAALTQLFSKMVEESATNAIVKGTIEDLGLVKKFEFLEDLLSDDSIWDLYERWIHHYLFPRDHNEKLKRFNQFKEMAKRVYNRNKMDGPFTLRLNNVADRTIEELCGAVVESGPRVSYYGNGGQMKS